jgi:hypothetical protein
MEYCNHLVDLRKIDQTVSIWWMGCTSLLTLGRGKKLFDNGTIPAAFNLTESLLTPRGVIFANYRRAGKVKTVLSDLKEK